MTVSTWPDQPDGDMTPILEASIEALEAKKMAVARHPSGGGPRPGIVLTAADRCDSCGASAAYRVMMPMATPEIRQPTLDFCLHHWRKNFPPMVAQGWVAIGGNPTLLAAMGQEALDYGS